MADFLDAADRADFFDDAFDLSDPLETADRPEHPERSLALLARRPRDLADAPPPVKFEAMLCELVCFSDLKDSADRTEIPLAAERNEESPLTLADWSEFC